MRALIGVITLIFIAGIAVVFADRGGPSVSELDQDIAAIEESIAEARRIGGQYQEGSIIRIQCELRIAVLETTKALLDQKRRAWIRGLTLNYQVQGRPVSPATPEEISAIEREIFHSLAKAETARLKAQKSGSLVQSFALVEEQTYLVTVAAAEQRLAMARLGLAFPTGRIPEQPNPIGKVIDDKGAL